jgi:hypothetical protein
VQAPTIVFDHVRKQVLVLGQQDPEAQKQLQELAAAQREQVATAGGAPAPRG